MLHTLWMAAERYTHLVFDPTQITDDERQRRYEKHRSFAKRRCTATPRR